MIYFSVEICPYGTLTRFPQEEEEFEFMTPPGTSSGDLTSGIPFNQGDNIMIRMANAPFSFFLLDLKYFATVRTRVRIRFTPASNRQPEVFLVSLYLTSFKFLNFIGRKY